MDNRGLTDSPFCDYNYAPSDMGLGLVFMAFALKISCPRRSINEWDLLKTAGLRAGTFADPFEIEWSIRPVTPEI